jgi:glycosyltransferase involved in cell wall biosynthesis
MNEQPAPTTRIIRLVTRLHVSGPALQAILLSSSLRAHGYETLLVVGKTDPDDSLLSVAERYGVRVIVLDDLTRTLNPLRLLRAMRKLYALMREHQPHIVHTHTTTAGFIGRVIARLAGVPIVVHTLHTHPFRGYYNRLQSTLFILLERIGARLSDSIITLSEKLRRELIDRHHIAHKNEVIVLPMGFNLRPFAQAERHNGALRARWHIPPDVPLVGIVGRLMAVKNHALFLQVAHRLRERLPNAHFVIVGDGELRATLEAQARALGLTDAVRFIGWWDDMPALYAELDALALTSWNEGTPVPIMEALVAGCAVVATDVGGVSDLLDGGKFGALVRAGDSEAFAQALAHALESPPDPQAARDAMLNRYGIDRLAQDMDSLYRGLRLRKGG